MMAAAFVQNMTAFIQKTSHSFWMEKTICTVKERERKKLLGIKLTW